jgi:hypothetical protein
VVTALAAGQPAAVAVAVAVALAVVSDALKRRPDRRRFGRTSDVNDDPARRRLVEILKYSSVTLDEAGMRELLPILQKFLADLNQASPVERALAYRLANLADGRIRQMLGSGLAASSIDIVFPANVTITASGGLTMAGWGCSERDHHRAVARGHHPRRFGQAVRP